MLLAFDRRALSVAGGLNLNASWCTLSLFKQSAWRVLIWTSTPGLSCRGMALLAGIWNASEFMVAAGHGRAHHAAAEHSQV